MNYPSISYKITDSNENDVSKFLPIESKIFKIDFSLWTSSTHYEPILHDDIKLIVKTFDNNVNLLHKEDGYYLSVLREGTCQIGVYYGDTFVKIEVLVYGNWFKNNYAVYFLSRYDRNILDNNSKAKVMFDTYAEFIDMLFAYVHDIDGINNPMEIKKKFLFSLSLSKGFDSIQYINEGSALEYKMDMIYRELITNLVDIAQTRGTRLSYELFFGSLGFDIELLEFWYDNKGRLVEVNPVDDSESGFLAYNVYGLPLEEEVDDPRVAVNVTGNYNINMKSNYVMPIITLKDSYDAKLLSTQKTLLTQFLEMLKPKHMNYLIQVFKLNLLSLVEDNKSIELLNHFWGTIQQLKPVVDSTGNSRYGTSWIEGAFETLGVQYHYNFVEGGKYVTKNLGVPEFVSYESYIDTGTYVDGNSVAAEEPPATDIITDSQQQADAAKSTYSTEYNTNVKYENDDFSDSQEEINRTTKITTTVKYYNSDVLLGNCFGKVGSANKLKEQAQSTTDSSSDDTNDADDSTIVVEDDLTDEEESDDDVVSELDPETNQDVSDDTEEEDGEEDDTEDENNEETNEETDTNTNIVTFKNGYYYPYVYSNEPPCNITHNDGRLYYGAWNWGLFPRGTFVEFVNIEVFIKDEFIISRLFEIYDILHEPLRYDAKSVDGTYLYRYDGDFDLGVPSDGGVASEQLHYDSGVMLGASIKFIDTTQILSDYYQLKVAVELDKTLTEDYVINGLIQKYGISLIDYYNIVQ